MIIRLIHSINVQYVLVSHKDLFGLSRSTPKWRWTPGRSFASARTSGSLHWDFLCQSIRATLWTPRSAPASRPETSTTCPSRSERSTLQISTHPSTVVAALSKEQRRCFSMFLLKAHWVCVYHMKLCYTNRLALTWLLLKGEHAIILCKSFPMGSFLTGPVGVAVCGWTKHRSWKVHPISSIQCVHVAPAVCLFSGKLCENRLTFYENTWEWS